MLIKQKHGNKNTSNVYLVGVSVLISS